MYNYYNKIPHILPSEHITHIIHWLPNSKPLFHRWSLLPLRFDFRLRTGLSLDQRSRFLYHDCRSQSLLISLSSPASKSFILVQSMCFPVRGSLGYILYLLLPPLLCLSRSTRCIQPHDFNPCPPECNWMYEELGPVR